MQEEFGTRTLITNRFSDYYLEESRKKREKMKTERWKPIPDYAEYITE
jgi:hypothetical protein